LGTKGRTPKEGKKTSWKKYAIRRTNGIRETVQISNKKAARKFNEGWEKRRRGRRGEIRRAVLRQDGRKRVSRWVSDSNTGRRGKPGGQVVGKRRI